MRETLGCASAILERRGEARRGASVIDTASVIDAASVEASGTAEDVEESRDPEMRLGKR